MSNYHLYACLVRHMSMRWPRSRYSGIRIAGIRLTVLIDITCWRFTWPSIRNGSCLGLGPVRVWFSAAYDRRCGA